MTPEEQCALIMARAEGKCIERSTVNESGWVTAGFRYGKGCWFQITTGLIDRVLPRCKSEADLLF